MYAYKYFKGNDICVLDETVRPSSHRWLVIEVLLISIIITVMVLANGGFETFKLSATVVTLEAYNK